MHAFESIVEALMTLGLRDLQDMHSERINRFFRCRKTLTSHFIFLRTGIKRTHPVPSQDYTADDSSNPWLSAQKCSCLSRCMRARIIVVKSDPFSAVGFPDFLEDNWQNKWLCTTQN